jgi:hypothetical protein
MSDKKRNTFFHRIFCSRAKNGEKKFYIFYRKNSYTSRTIKLTSLIYHIKKGCVCVLSCVFLLVALQYMYLTGRIAREWMLKHSRLIKTNIALLQSAHITSFFHSLVERDLDHFARGKVIYMHSCGGTQ